MTKWKMFQINKITLQNDAIDFKCNKTVMREYGTKQDAWKEPDYACYF